MSALTTEDDLSIVVTDSGLGGLDVAARLARRVRQDRLCSRLRLTFVNCKPAADVGYHDLPHDEQRCRVFSRALEAMTQRFDPHAILIACNSLSAIYRGTSFAAATKRPVHGIIEAGCNLAGEFLDRRPDGRVVIFSTPMTAASAVHARTLEAAGFNARQLVAQPCPGLAGAIDHDPHSDAVRQKIDDAVFQAIAQVGDLSQPIAAALFCTHFGYVADVFIESFRRHGVQLNDVLNPNPRMVELCLAGATPRDQPPRVEVKVVTQSPHNAQAKAGLAPLLECIDAPTSAALRHDVCELMFDIE